MFNDKRERRYYEMINERKKKENGKKLRCMLWIKVTLLTQITNEDLHCLPGNVLKPSVYELISKVINGSNGRKKNMKGNQRRSPVRRLER